MLVTYILTAAQVLVGIVKGKTLFRKSANFVVVIITLQNNASKGYERKSKMLVQLMFWTIDNWNGHLENALDVDLKIT